MTQLVQSFEAQLTDYRRLTNQALVAVLPTREPRHYLYNLMNAHIARSGKGVRPALCIATCRAFGGSLEKVLESATALELLHNAFLVHDDVEDGSEYRRNEPTLL